MAKSSEFHDYVIYDLMGDDPHITTRKMFGGYGLYKDSIIFGIIVENTLYFKVDESNKAAYEEYGSKPFHYSNGTKEVVMSYFEVPETILDDREKLFEWIDQSTYISKERKTRKTR